MQEVALAPRVLHFTGDQMVWQCPNYFADESHPDGFGLLRHNVGKTKLPEWCAFDPPGSGSFSDLRRRDMLCCWKEIVNLYSQGELTKRQQDKLVAINGLAKSLVKDFNEQ